MKAIYFASFYFRVFNSIREIRENKNLAKISTYTVYQEHLGCTQWHNKDAGGSRTRDCLESVRLLKFVLLSLSLPIHPPILLQYTF